MCAIVGSSARDGPEARRIRCVVYAFLVFPQTVLALEGFSLTFYRNLILNPEMPVPRVA